MEQLEEFTVPSYNDNYSTWIQSPKRKYPKGLYIAVPIKPQDFQNISAKLRSLGINTIKATSAHCTIVYSKTPQERFLPQSTNKRYVLYTEKNPLKIFGKGTQDSPYALVFAVSSPELTKLNKKYMQMYNMRVSFPEYLPHITLSYSIEKDLGIKISKNGIKKMEVLLNNLCIGFPRRINTGFQYFQSLK